MPAMTQLSVAAGAGAKRAEHARLLQLEHVSDKRLTETSDPALLPGRAQVQCDLSLAAVSVSAQRAQRTQ